MSTLVRPEISEDNKYYISKHRYYELKHFCLQYNEWKRAYAELEKRSVVGGSLSKASQSAYYISDRVGETASTLSELSRKMRIIRDACWKADETICDYILEAVTEGKSYTYLKMVEEMPCSKDMFYDRYRKFFWLLSMEQTR